MAERTRQSPLLKTRASATAGAAKRNTLTAETKSALKTPGGPLESEKRRAMICEAAYYLAERRGFAAGHDLEDWLTAEHQVDTALAKCNLPFSGA